MGCVCLSLAKYFNLASMFIERFVFTFACLSVLLSITHERFDISSPDLVHIFILLRNKQEMETKEFIYLKATQLFAHLLLYNYNHYQKNI